MEHFVVLTAIQSAIADVINENLANPVTNVIELNEILMQYWKLLLNMIDYVYLKLALPSCFSPTQCNLL